jgi:hypothetical protein
MTARRLILVATVAGLMGSSGTAAFAQGIGTQPETKRVCVMGTDDPTTHSWDGVCVWIPIH